MTARSTMMPFPARLRTEFKLDPVLLTIFMTLLLGGLVILASASITISDNATGNPFFYLQRQLLAAAIGSVAGLFCLFVPMRVWQSLGPLMLLLALVLLCVVLIPGVGHEVKPAGLRASPTVPARVPRGLCGSSTESTSSAICRISAAHARIESRLCSAARRT